MAIDTAAKRISVFELPGIMTNPFPDGVNTQGDRQQTSDIYAGIFAAAPLSTNETCWIPSKLNLSQWKNSKQTTNAWTREKTGTRIWVPEEEVVPCQD